jgi:hypothetical protein
VARFFGDQRQRDEAEVALRQHPPGAQVIGAHAATHAVAPATKAERAETAAAMASGTPFSAVSITISVHFHSHCA